jgi:TusA-related sulfurtransferase
MQQAWRGRATRRFSSLRGPCHGAARILLSCIAASRCAGRLKPVMPESTVLDLSGSEELCTEPGALERVRRAYARLEPGGRLEVRSPVAEHAFAVRAWSRKNGVSVVVDEPADGFRRLVLAAPAAGR